VANARTFAPDLSIFAEKERKNRLRQNLKIFKKVWKKT
jgi:hypothetical protein